ncbi:MAG: hypothetical protein AAB654_08645 [Acidobacteriota bacterium]
MARVKWSERPRTHRGAIIGAFPGMAVAAVVVFQYAFYGSTLDRYLIMMAGLLIGGGVGALVAKMTAPRP